MKTKEGTCDFKELVHQELYDVKHEKEDVLNAFAKRPELSQLEVVFNNLLDYHSFPAKLARDQLKDIAALWVLYIIEPQRFDSVEEKNKLDAAIAIGLKSIDHAIRLAVKETA